MKTLSFCKKGFLLTLIFLLIFYTLTMRKLHFYRIQVFSTISPKAGIIHIKNQKDISTFPSSFDKIEFGTSKAYIVETICIENDIKNKTIIVKYNTQKNYSVNFNGFNILLRSHSIVKDFKYHNNFNLFFVKGAPFVTFLANLHHFYKDLAVDIFSVLRRLPHSEIAKNW